MNCATATAVAVAVVCKEKQRDGESGDRSGGSTLPLLLLLEMTLCRFSCCCGGDLLERDDLSNMVLMMVILLLLLPLIVGALVEVPAGGSRHAGALQPPAAAYGYNTSGKTTATHTSEVLLLATAV